MYSYILLTFTKIDSNILIYSINISSPKHKKAQDFLKKNIGLFVVAQQNIFETLRVLTHPKFPSPMRSQDAIESVGRILKAGEVVTPDHKTYQIALELIKKYNLVSDKVFDAYLVATCLSSNVDTVAIDNVKDFKIYPQIQVPNPFIEVN